MATKISERIMENVSIAKSFKGILRIAHISDVSSTEEDTFSNKSLYTSDGLTPKELEKIGSLTALPALEGAMTRYNYQNDSLRDKRVPITDSVGNYLNWNVGFDGVTIGSNEKINYNLIDKSETKVFPILKSAHAIVGLEKILIKSEKQATSTNGGKVTIEGSNNSRGMVIVKTNDSTRTVYSPSRLAKNGEVLMFRQDDYRNVDGVKHYFTDFVNIEDYIKDKLNKYLKGNIMEVPSGTVIYHACSLTTWRSDCTNYDKGPAMQQRGANNSWSIQGACKKINNYGDNLIPLFKRDYLLCDGSSYKIVYVPKTFSTSVASNLIENRERFFELFFNLGYYYTEKRILFNRPKTNFSNNQPNIIYSTSISGATKPKLVEVTDKSYSGLDDIDALFQEDLATMLCCDEIYKFVREYQQKYKKLPTKNEIEKYIENAKIPEEYIFNSFVGDNENTIGKVSGLKNTKLLNLTYKTADDEEVKLNLGKEINKFGDFIKFYDNSDNIYRAVKVYKLPLVTYFITLLLKGLSDANLIQHLQEFYTYKFQVPSFVSDDFSPTFIGSGAYMINSINYKKQNLPQSWSGTEVRGIIPHRHYIALTKGTIEQDTEQNGSRFFVNYEPYNINDISDTNNKSYEQSFNNRFYNAETLTDQHVVVAEFCDGKVLKTTGGKGGWNITMEDASNSYILRDVPVKLKSNYTINGFKPLFAQTISSGDIIADTYSPEGGTDAQKIDYLGRDISTSFGNADPRFDNAEPNRGITDIAYYEQISATDDEKITTNLKNFSKCTSTSYFSMENVTLLPLIKI